MTEKGFEKSGFDVFVGGEPWPRFCLLVFSAKDWNLQDVWCGDRKNSQVSKGFVGK